MFSELGAIAARKALAGSSFEQEVKMTFGELFLFHVLLQEHGFPYVGEERFIPLMERSVKRIESVERL